MNTNLENKIDSKALFNLSYGLYVVTSHDGIKDNALIVNTVVQLTSKPLMVSVTISKENYSHDVIKNTKKMNVNCLTVDTPFDIFKKYGFASGKDVDKFENEKVERSDNDLVVMSKYINSYLSLEVENYIDLGTHGMFICQVTEAKTINKVETMTYSYYHQNVKPKPGVKQTHSYQCSICGFVYEGEELPEDYVCPLCKHGAEFFEKI